MKKIIRVICVLTVFMFGVALSACSKKSDDAITINFMVQYPQTREATKVLQAVIEAFEEETPGVVVNFIPGSPAYEGVMKTKMAAQDLPDLWTTHGWSVHRYSEYLRPLNDQPFFQLLDSQIKPVITNSNGETFVLPVDKQVSGIMYSKTIFDRLNIDVDAIQTMDDLFAVMQQIKDAGITPFHIAGKDIWPIGNVADWVAPAVLISNEQDNERQALKSGQFDVEKWELVAEFYTTLRDREFVNKDVLTAIFQDSAEAFATETAAMGFYGNNAIVEALSYNPDMEYGFFPVPAYHEGDAPTLIAGEGLAIGVYKDTAHEAEVLQLLNYIAKPDNVARLASANGNPTGLTNATSSLGSIDAYFAKYQHIRAFPFFDREYLPSGMWDTICNTASALMAGDMSPKDAAQKMFEDFQKLYK